MLTIGTKVRIKVASKSYYKKIKFTTDWSYHTKEFIRFLGNKGIIVGRMKRSDYFVYEVNAENTLWPLKAFTFLEEELEALRPNYNE